MISSSTCESEVDLEESGKANMNYKLIEFLQLSNKINKEELEVFLNSKNIIFKDLESQSDGDIYQKIRLKVVSEQENFSKLELLKNETFPGNESQLLKLRYLLTIDDGLTIGSPEEDELITYPHEYHRMILTDFERKEGCEGLEFKNKELINKQRAVMTYLIKKMGSNLFSGKSIMNISLPINIFDVRSHLEVFTSQTCYAGIFLQKASETKDPLECLKLSTTFALTTVHLAVAQLKPFNPILGETFQVKIAGSLFYLEQTSHHPPIFNFFIEGSNFKIFGYNESEVSSGANSIKAKYKGSYTIQFENGTQHKVYFPEFKLSGTLFGSRSIKYYGNLIVTDTRNDLISFIAMDPDDRGFFTKIFAKKKVNPDYFKGLITLLSKNSKWNKKQETFSILDMNKNVLSNIEGEFSQCISFDNINYWEYEKTSHPEYRRMRFTLPSDSTLREDINWLKDGKESHAQMAKIKLEERQRNDKKLREKLNKSK